MHIKRLEIKNCLGIKEFELNAGQVNLVRGANESGKTSILESIEKALRNTERRVNFVHQEAEEGTLYLELDDGLAIDRRIKAQGSCSVKLTQHGKKVPKPETFLKQLTGAYAFNPVDFLSHKDKEQAEILLSILPLHITQEQLRQWFGAVPPVNLNQHPIALLTYLAEKYFYDMRALANSEVKESQQEIDALFEQLPDNYNAADWRHVDIGRLWQRVQQAQQINAGREQAAHLLQAHPQEERAIMDRYEVKLHKIGRRQEEEKKQQQQNKEEQIMLLQADIQIKEKEIRRLQEQIAHKQAQQEKITEAAFLREEGLAREIAAQIKATAQNRKNELEQLQQKKKKALTYLDEHKQVEIEPLKRCAHEAEQMKGYLQLADNRERLQASLQEKSKRAALLHQNVNTARRLPAELLAAAELPVAGLGINKNMQLTVDKLPMRNLSTGRQIKLALDIARATAGPLKLICIDRFESLDPINQELFFREIESDGYQYFISTTQLQVDEKGNYLTGLSVQTRQGKEANR